MATDNFGLNFLNSLSAIRSNDLKFYTRISLRCRNTDATKGLQARTADPLWMLAREWQMGEFQAEDAGSPIGLCVKYKTRHMGTVQNIDGLTPSGDTDMPPEIVVEREKVPVDWRMRVQGGQVFESCLSGIISSPELRKEIICFCRDKYPIRLPEDESITEIDYETQRYIRFMSGRVTDVFGLMSAVEAGNAIHGDYSEKIREAITLLEKEWLRAIFVQPEQNDPSFWKPEQLCFQFEQKNKTDEIGTGSSEISTELVADRYRNGEFDWYSLDVKNIGDSDWKEYENKDLVPAPIRISGASPRWWELEDGRTDFGNLDAESADLVKLAVMNFSLIYGDDWFSFPLEIEMGNLCRLTRLEVSDVFGVKTEIPAARVADKDPLKSWSMFDLAPATACDLEKLNLANTLYVPYTVNFKEESKPLEEIRFVRDEMANMVWGIEEKAMNGLGKAVSGAELQTERNQRLKEYRLKQLRLELKEKLDAGSDVLDKIKNEIKLLEEGPAPAAEDAIPTYKLATKTPLNWVPFIPVNASPFLVSDIDQVSIKLRRAVMLSNEDNETPSDIPALSGLLKLDENTVAPFLWLNEESVPREGARVQLTKQRVRWTDGRTLVWIGKKVSIGRGEAGSGLLFDQLIK